MRSLITYRDHCRFPLRVVAAIFFLIMCFSSILNAAAQLPVEARGVWLRPPQDTATIPEMLERIQKAGFNMVFVETFYHGFTLYPNSIVPPRPEYGETDVLRIFLSEGHKRNLQIHAWVEVFYWQVDTEKYPNLPRTPLFDSHPDWLLRLRTGKLTSESESAHIFANPAHPEVQQFLLNYFKELLSRYDIDGLNLDYIRYSSGKEDAGYDAYSRREFKTFAGVDPIDIDQQTSPALWLKWVEWRENQVTGFVEKVSHLVRSVKPSVWLSTAVFPGYYGRRPNDPHLQDWATWAKKGLIDMVMPMAYAPTLDKIEGDILEVKDRIQKPGASGQKVYLVPALAIAKKAADAYGGPTHPPIAEQIALVRKLSTSGNAVFCYDWILDSEEGFKAFRKGPYERDAAPPVKRSE
jgi:uncharacterized lipoprotein YddW (UPF0748 family)